MEKLLLNLLGKAPVLGAVDVFQNIQKAAQSFQSNLQIIAPIIFVCSAGLGALMFVFGRKGAESGKSHIGQIMLGVCIFVAAASLIATLFSIFGSHAQGI
ncbi:TrbC/VirB2 family protein [Enterococcus gilvus]|uniref:TrbC/VirB2 family protein n=1 Tax=Enterococcus gilvus TaxID=160453 RepID=UPI0028D639F2|nr:TrbC/VirB2 family protein [Enterococcus gilvus]